MGSPYEQWGPIGLQKMGNVSNFENGSRVNQSLFEVYHEASGLLQFFAFRETSIGESKQLLLRWHRLSSSSLFTLLTLHSFNLNYKLNSTVALNDRPNSSYCVSSSFELYSFIAITLRHPALFATIWRGTRPMTVDNQPSRQIILANLGNFSGNVQITNSLLSPAPFYYVYYRLAPERNNHNSFNFFDFQELKKDIDIRKGNANVMLNK